MKTRTTKKLLFGVLLLALIVLLGCNKCYIYSTHALVYQDGDFYGFESPVILYRANTVQVQGSYLPPMKIVEVRGEEYKNMAVAVLFGPGTDFYMLIVEADNDATWIDLVE